MLVTVPFAEGPDYRVALVYDDVTLVVSHLVVEQDRGKDAEIELWSEIPLLGLRSTRTKATSLTKTHAIEGVTLVQRRYPDRGDRLGLPEGVMLGVGTV